ncbi:rhamnosyltransferase, partial [Candidatus Roizmanbacteria bacterium]|nr:rhamnosyltransferase [Candidatus Roizmanbacteria bacterium]
ANALVYHSHEYTLSHLGKRYFDIGVFLSREKWYTAACGKPEGEGNKFVLSEIKHLAKLAPWLIPSSLVRTGLKFLGYKIGQKEQYIPMWLKGKMSMNKGYWKNA